MSPLDQTPRPASTALTETGGFLAGFTHTLNPYVGCPFACDYCYVQGSPVHLFHQPRMPWGAYAHPRTGIAEQLQKELARFAAKGALDQVSIFMSSATDPYQGLERQWRLTRACLDVFLVYPPGLLTVQTRSPFVADDFARLRTLGKRCWLNVTLETDLDAVRQAVTPQCPSVARRLETLQQALTSGLQVQVVVSPCLPYSTVETFGALLLAHSQRVIVDTYTSGDGTQGKRTAKTAIPARYHDLGWGDWRSEEAALALYEWLHQQIGARVGWSQAGFTVLAKQAAETRG